MQSSSIQRFRSIIATIHSLSGQGGHAGLYKASLAGMGLSLPQQDVIAELAGPWNHTNTGGHPWSLAEIQHKVADAYKSTRLQPGYLFNEPPSSARLKAFGTPRPTPVNDEDQRSAERRAQWAPVRLASNLEIQTIAKLRGVHPGIACAAANEGFLRMTTFKGYECFAMVADKFSQVRRIDGRTFKKADGTEAKSINQPGSRGRWFLHSLLMKYPAANVLIGEGLIGSLEMMQAITESRFQAFVPFCAMSAGVNLGEPELLLLRGRRVIIARDRGEVGAEAAVRWQESLATMGVVAPIWTPPMGVKDLGEALLLPAFDCNSIFTQA